MSDTHGRPGHPDPGITAPSLEWPPPPDALDGREALTVRRVPGALSVLRHQPVASLTGESPESSCRPDDLVWPPPTADVDAVAVVTLDGRAVGGGDQHAASGRQRVSRAFRRPLVAAAGLLATAVLAWSGWRSGPSPTATSTTVAAAGAPAARTPTRLAARPAVAQVPTQTSHPETRSTGTMTVAGAETRLGTRPAALATDTPPPAHRAPADAAPVTPAPPPPPHAVLARPMPMPTPRAAAALTRSYPAQAQDAAAAEPVPGPPLTATVAYEPRRPATVALPPPPESQSLVARAEPNNRTAALPVSAPASPRTPADGPRIQAVLQQYASAYRRLDATAARAVWPSLDSRALARAFDGLQSQQLVFDGCDVAVDGARAQAACHGSATYVPRVGDRTPRTQPRQWTFQLERVEGEQWRILTASTR